MSMHSKLTRLALLAILLGAGLTTAAQQNRNGPARTESAPPRGAEPGSKRPAKNTSQQINHVTLEIIAPVSAAFGVTADYELVVRNQGASPVENVRVEAELPAGSEFVAANPTADVEEGTASWRLDRLNAGEETRIKMQLKPMEEGTLDCHAMVTCTALAGVQTMVTRPQVVLAMNGPPEVAVGQKAVFSLKISNPGSGAAKNVLVRDVVPAGFEHPAGEEIEYEVGTLEPGEAREVRLELLAKGAGAQKNYAQVTAEGGLKHATELAVRVLEPQLAIAKIGPKRRYLDRPATFNIQVSNTGTAAASRISVVDEVPEGFTFIEANETGRLDPDKKFVRWSLDQLGPGESRNLSVTVRPTSIGEYVTHTVATAEGGLRAQAEASTVVEGITNLFLELIDIHGTIEVGSETVYEIRVVNRGTQAATNVIIQAMAPPGMTPLKAEGPVSYEVSGREVVFEPIGRLAPRADAGFQIRVRGDRPGDMRFTVELHCDQLETSLKKQESTHVYADQ